MSTDPFERLRIVDEPAAPDPRFVTRLRSELAAALEPPQDLPTIDLPERSLTVTLVPYLCTNPASDAIGWYADVFGAIETIRYTGDDGRVGHAEISIGGAQVMLSDEYPEIGVVSPTTLGGTTTSMHLTVPDVDAVHARAVEGGARVEREPHEEVYGARTTTIVDPFGHRWMVQTPTGSPSVEEIQQASTGYTITTPEAD